MTTVATPSAIVSCRAMGRSLLLASDHDRRAVSEQSLIGRHPNPSSLDLSMTGLAPQLPGQFAHLRDRLGGNGLAERPQASAGIDRDPPTDLCVTGPE